MAKPKAFQSPNAEVTPSSSSPAKKPGLERPFKAEKSPWEPSSSRGPWVGLSPLPYTCGCSLLPQPGRAGGCRDPQPMGKKWGAGFGQQHPAKGADPVSCCSPEPGTQGAEQGRCRGTVPWDGAVALPGLDRSSTSHLSCSHVGSCWWGSSVGTRHTRVSVLALQRQLSWAALLRDLWF